MNILIVSYYFYPNNTPRAFRTHELVKELCKRGIQVHLILPNRAEFTECPDERLKSFSNLKITLLGENESFAKPSFTNKFKSGGAIRKLAKNIYRYFNPYGETRPYIKLLFSYLKGIASTPDIIISIATPFSTLVGTAKAIEKNLALKNCPVKVAEYSDPFSLQISSRMFFGYKIVDRWIAKTFDFISIPTEKAVPSYERIKPVEKIKVIPQGFNFDEVRINKYSENKIPCFGYAGVFYSKIRNPKLLFEFLSEVKCEYRFLLFTISTNIDTKVIIEEYKKSLGNRLVVEYDLSRLQVIEKLSTIDFLINIDNLSSNQTPSKLIDYSLAQRPIYSFSPKNFKKEIFLEFLNRDYSQALKVDISEFNIKVIVDKFLSLK